jgi:hypothetical protein
MQGDSESLRIQLYQILSQRFSEQELRILCFFVGLEYDDLEGKGRAGKAMELITYFERRHQLSRLVEAVVQTREDIIWPVVSEGVDEPAFPINTSDALINGVLSDLCGLRLDHSPKLPSRELFPQLRRLFSRPSFGVNIVDCTSRDWVHRLYLVFLTHKILSDFPPEDRLEFYNDLLLEVGHYIDNLTGLFEKPFTTMQIETYVDDEAQFRKRVGAYTPLDTEQLLAAEDKRKTVARCDANLERISSLWESIGLGPTLRVR